MKIGIKRGQLLKINSEDIASLKVHNTNGEMFQLNGSLHHVERKVPNTDNTGKERGKNLLKNEEISG